MPDHRPEPTIPQLVSRFEAAIKDARAVLYEAGEQLADGDLLEAVADIDSYFFAWDCDLEKSANALLNALPDEEADDESGRDRAPRPGRERGP